MSWNRGCLVWVGTLVAIGGYQNAWGEPSPAENRPQVIRDLAYGPRGDRNTLDLYLPVSKHSRPLPLVIWVHGGAWANGSKAAGGPARRLVEHGYAVASINYRLSGQAIFPAQIEDCKAAVRFLRANSQKYELDPERFGAWGSSAGGHLVALLGTSADVPELEGKVGDYLEVSSRVQAVCDWFGPTDFLQMDDQAPADSRIRHNSPNSAESRLLGGPLQDNPLAAAKANPITYVTPDDPPFLIMHGDRDDVVPIGQSQLLHDALQKAGVEVTFHSVRGAGHGLGGEELMQMVEAFFAKQLRDRPDVP